MYSQIASNKRKTILLMIGFVGFIGALAWLMSEALGRPSFVWLAVVFAVGYALFSYFASAKMALALSGAKPVTKAQAPKLYRTVENLAITAGLPMPKVYVINDPAPNAFATGRDPQHAAVAATTGLLEMMDDSELEGVIAHELSHVGNYDIRVMSIVIALVTIVSLLADFFLRWSFFGGSDDDEGGSSGAVFAVIGLVMALVAPLVATLLQLAVSRRREFLADASGVLLTRYPDGLARALAKIGGYAKPMRHANTATAHLFIANPLGGRGIGAGVAKLFSTHPPVEARIARLKEMETSA
ncbi:M48 family metalloprotease [Candidatus Parcubacteria bacterium]|nr:M48 family metalloprotease [Candidatus Parcubacteria bacterium]